MSLLFNGITFKKRGTLIDLCMTLQKTGVVVAIVYGDIPKINILTSADLPVITSLKEINYINDIEEYVYHDNRGEETVVYGKEAANKYRPHNIIELPKITNSQATITFNEKDFIRTFIFYPLNIISTDIIL